jgi:hypothetical protein
MPPKEKGEGVNFRALSRLLGKLACPCRCGYYRGLKSGEVGSTETFAPRVRRHSGTRNTRCLSALGSAGHRCLLMIRITRGLDAHALRLAGTARVTRVPVVCPRSHGSRHNARRTHRTWDDDVNFVIEGIG